MKTEIDEKLLEQLYEVYEFFEGWIEDAAEIGKVYPVRKSNGFTCQLMLDDSKHLKIHIFSDEEIV